MEIASYASPQDFVDYFGATEALRTSQIDNPAATRPDDERLQQALSDATDEINSYIQEAYDLVALQLDPPRRLKGCCLDIARYRLVKNRPPDDYRQRYEDAIAWLTKVAKGTVSLGFAKSGEAIVNSDAATYVAAPRIFTSRSLRSY